MDNFQAYGEFARVYDMFQDNVDYQTWGKWLKQQLAAQGITDGLVLDLGCGTGTMTEILAEAGYDMIGSFVNHVNQEIKEKVKSNNRAPMDCFQSLFCRLTRFG